MVAGRNAAKSAAAAKEIGGEAIEVDVTREASLQAPVGETVKRHRHGNPGRRRLFSPGLVSAAPR